ncbi:hypothetical protein D3C83_255650 [compost metagenome]
MRGELFPSRLKNALDFRKFGMAVSMSRDYFRNEPVQTRQFRFHIRVVRADDVP